ncbi:MAG: metallophosphoesterase N-terminal domain-containing protein [Armatimonadota bacterium]|nr:calcineurin-like phosphoesterase family protein [Armatimonadota bacterium]MCX7776618.1 calcineurin-like phosphoesterase family protein [Armatimonadota bacterium]MDW8025239.1 metallophosphoesterase N-terminal domain-containing protein [Armatimonadota bacterium]
MCRLQNRLPYIVVLSMALWLYNLSSLATCASVTGRVFEDANGNGTYDDGEAAIAGVIVTDGRKVTVTDAHGHYKLTCDQSTRFIYITQPTGWKATQGWFKRLSANEKGDAAKIDFPMVKQKQQMPFFFIHITDVHIASPATAMSLHRLLTEIDGAQVKPSFIVITGDLVAAGDAVPESTARHLFELYKGACEGIILPVYHVVGNHDLVSVNFKGNGTVDTFSEAYGKGMFEMLLSPRYYGFEHAGIHFLSLDLHPIHDGRQAIGLDVGQIEWLRQYARCLKGGTKLIMFAHVPITRIPAEQAILLLGMFSHCKLLSIHSGDEHRVFSIDFGSWRQFISGALSGSWWTGPNPDGYPQGYSIVCVEDAKVDVRYVPAWRRLAPIPVEPPVTVAYGGFNMIPTYSGVQRLLVQTLRIHTDAKSVRARIGFGKWTELRKVRDEICTSLWEGLIETEGQRDGMAMLTISAGSEGISELSQYRIFVYNARTPYTATEDAVLHIELDEVDGMVSVFVEELEVAKVQPKDGAKRVIASLRIPKDVLTKRVVKVRLASGIIGKSQVDDLIIRHASLIYGGRKLADERISGTITIGDDITGRKGEAVLLFELP